MNSDSALPPTEHHSSAQVRERSHSSTKEYNDDTSNYADVQRADCRRRKLFCPIRPVAGDSTPQTHENFSLGVSKRSLHASTTGQSRMVIFLRFTVLLLLLACAALLSVFVYLYTQNNNTNSFIQHFQKLSSAKIVNGLSLQWTRALNEMDSLSTTITSHALQQQQASRLSNQTTNDNNYNNTFVGFPFVTLPDFVLRGATLRVQTGGMAVHWLPLVQEEQRQQWQSYALQERSQIDQAFEEDQRYRLYQDQYFARLKNQTSNNNDPSRSLHDSFSQTNDEELTLEYDYLQTSHARRRTQSEGPKRNMTILDDGTGFHAEIWSNGANAPPGDQPIGSGPYLPTWQRSPVNAQKQSFLNIDFSMTKAIFGALDILMAHRVAWLGPPIVPVPLSIESFKANLKIGQYRLHVTEYSFDPVTFLVYPVFDSFDMENRQVTGVITVTLHWKSLLSNLLGASTKGIICVIDTNYNNQTFSYRLDGQGAQYLGADDFHSPEYEFLEESININELLQHNAEPLNTVYTAVPLYAHPNGGYRIRIYPSAATQEPFVTNEPIMYTVIVICTFAVTSMIFICYSYTVEKRQRNASAAAIGTAKQAATAERDFNEFLAHEVRNPLSAAMSACSFVSSAVNQPKPLSDPKDQAMVQEDISVIGTCLRFINDFLRITLDISRADSGRLELKKASTDVIQDVISPVVAMLYTRNANYQVLTDDCPESLVIQADNLRLKQVVLNLARNSQKFVEKGFIRLRVSYTNHKVFIFVEDSGPGIPEEKQNALFAKFQSSLDLMSQGTGIGLCLSKNLVEAMDGELSFDNSYDSGVEGCPGTRFVIQLNHCEPLMDLGESAVLHFQKESGDNDTATASLTEQQQSMDPPVISTRKSGTQFSPPPFLVSTSNLYLPKELKVLFVDDDLVVRKLFVRALRRTCPSWTIREAASGETALQIVFGTSSPSQNDWTEQQHFDLIFMDQYMASVDKQLLGTETISTLRARGVTNSVICGLSANDLGDSFHKAGADFFKLKPLPCNPDELTKELLEMVGRPCPEEPKEKKDEDRNPSLPQDASSQITVSLSPKDETLFIEPEESV